MCPTQARACAQTLAQKRCPQNGPAYKDIALLHAGYAVRVPHRSWPVCLASRTPFPNELSWVRIQLQINTQMKPRDSHLPPAFSQWSHQQHHHKVPPLSPSRLQPQHRQHPLARNLAPGSSYPRCLPSPPAFCLPAFRLTCRTRAGCCLAPLSAVLVPRCLQSVPASCLLASRPTCQTSAQCCITPLSTVLVHRQA